MSASAVREVCHCGHAKDTHHEGVGPCLGLGCNVASADWQSSAVTNECPRYRDDRKPDTYDRPSERRPYHPSTCLCFYCKPSRTGGAQ